MKFLKKEFNVDVTNIKMEDLQQSDELFSR
jgi:hypothetical protein